MIPLKDTIPSQTYPFVNYSFIVLNFLVFLFELGQGPHLERFIQEFGVVPYYFKLSYRGDGAFLSYLFTKYFPLLSSLFLHGGWLHFLGNMLFLWIFGDNVEDRLGHFRYFVFYLVCGITASVSHIVMNLNSTIPSIGASGAIAGVLGAYVLLYPWARVRTLIFIFIFFDIIELPAFIFIFFWFLLQLFSGLGALVTPQGGGGIAWFAHIGGFLSGLIVVNVLKRRKSRKKPPRFQRYKPSPW